MQNPIPIEHIELLREYSDRIRQSRVPSLTVEGSPLDGVVLPFPSDWKDGEARAIDLVSLVTGEATQDFVFIRRGDKMVFDRDRTELFNGTMNN